jgi:manganese/zinc/iron transport system permease protein
VFSPQKGLFFRYWRMRKFKSRCLQENILKQLWKKEEKGSVFSEIALRVRASRLSLMISLWKLSREGWVKKKAKQFFLTPDGQKRSAHIVRLHRLWEVYLVFLGHQKEKVHSSAEEMEHVITPELEAQLTALLHNPQRDPHEQPIPEESL